MDKLITGYQYDSESLFYDGETVVQCFDDVPNYPSNVIGVKPALKAGYWYKCKNGTSWTAVKKPTSCAEAVESGLSAVANSPKEHDREVVSLLQSLVSAESDKYRIATDPDTLVMSIEAIPEKTLDELKAEKLEALTAYAGQFDQYKCDEMYVTSSNGGYKFNADIRSQTNMQGLIDVLDEVTTTLYKDYDNEFRTMTKADLAVLKSECLQNGQYLYQQKWTLQTKINSCTSKEELDAIEIKFEMLEFNHAD